MTRQGGRQGARVLGPPNFWINKSNQSFRYLMLVTRQCPGTSTPRLTVSLYPCRFGSNIQGEVLRRSVRSKSPPGINDFFSTYLVLAPLDLIACALPDDKGVVYKDARKM